MEKAARKFWNWFAKNQKALIFINEMEPEQAAKLHDGLDKLLEKCSDNLFYEIGGMDNQKRQLIITAGGNPDFFGEAEKLVGYAPTLEDWEFFALKPALPKGTLIQLTIDNFLFDNRDMWFQPFRKPSDVQSLGLVVFMRMPLEIPSEKLIANGLFNMLYLTLGERSATLDIQTVEIAIIDEDEPQERGVKPLLDLPEFIEYFNRERRGMPFS
jgi:hypothetical protein